MLKFLLITFLILYTLYKVSQFIFRLFLAKYMSRAQNGNFSQSKQHKQTAKNSNLNIDYMPDKNGVAKRNTDMKGGEYVDFEEIKE